MCMKSLKKNKGWPGAFEKSEGNVEMVITWYL